jgi:hypothetical protein
MNSMDKILNLGAYAPRGRGRKHSTLTYTLKAS